MDSFKDSVWMQCAWHALTLAHSRNRERGLEEAAGNNHFANAIATLRAHALILSYTSRTGSVVTSPH